MAREHWLRRLARAQITCEPLCRACLARGKIEPATCADHITPHAGNVNAFFLSPLRSLCHACHALKTVRETRGYSKQIGLDGLPVDPAHPGVWAAKWDQYKKPYLSCCRRRSLWAMCIYPANLRIAPGVLSFGRCRDRVFSVARGAHAAVVRVLRPSQHACLLAANAAAASPG